MADLTLEDLRELAKNYSNTSVEIGELLDRIEFYLQEHSQEPYTNDDYSDAFVNALISKLYDLISEYEI